MTKAPKLQVLTANDLLGGHSVYLGPEGWSPRLGTAMVALTPDQAREFEALGARFEQENQIVGGYLIEVEQTPAGLVAVTRREKIRAAGVPTVAVGPAEPAARAA